MFKQMMILAYFYCVVKNAAITQHRRTFLAVGLNPVPESVVRRTAHQVVKKRTKYGQPVPVDGYAGNRISAEEDENI